MGGKGLIALALALAACGGVAAKPAPMVFQPGHIDLARGPDGNTEILDAPEGLIVVDTGRHSDHARAIIDHARGVGKPVIAIVNTHWHLDHTTGNRDILAAFPGAKVIASRAVDGALADFLARSRTQAVEALASGKLTPAERARAERALAAVEDRAALVPSMPVVGDGARMLGGRRIEFHLALNAATEGDVWMVVPDEKLAIVGDLVVAPVPFFDTGCEDGWTAALAAIDAASWDRLAPGHGAVMSRADFSRWRSAFLAFLGCARSNRPGADCAARWSKDAESFYTSAEAPSVNAMARYYVEQVLRAPAKKRMAYCRPAG